ncbi:MAG: dihydropteroate synthase, partial [Clostridiales bacterium]|nr:dihydropteroate synthase [Clostridiales bacterium]
MDILGRRPGEGRTLIMGILNCTPDSFSDGGLYLDSKAAADHALALISQGADIIDIGGESTRPGFTPVDKDEELKRVIPVITSLRDTGVIMSVDTTKMEVAKAAVEAGARVINDIS